MPDPAAPDRSQLDDFIDRPMGPGLSGEEPVGQSVHPQAPQPGPPYAAQAEAAESGAAQAGSAPSSAAPVDPTKQAPGERLGSEIAAARVDLSPDVLREPKAGGATRGDDTGGL